MQNITESEYKIMEVLWKAEEALSFTNIREELQKTTPWEPSTIKTMLDRLVKKGVVHAARHTIYFYTPAFTREAYNQAETDRLMERLYNGNAGELIAALIQTNALSQEDRDSLLSLLRGDDDDA